MGSMETTKAMETVEAFSVPRTSKTTRLGLSLVQVSRLNRMVGAKLTKGQSGTNNSGNTSGGGSFFNKGNNSNSTTGSSSSFFNQSNNQ